MAGALNGDLVLIRHGQTQCTRAGRFCGAHDGRLTEAGRLMAEHAARHPALAGVDMLLSSPSRRAAVCAEAVARYTDVAVTLDDRLRELSFGEWEDRLPAEVDDAAYRRWAADPALFAPPGGESGLAVLVRSVDAVREALERAAHVAVVTHKAPVRLILAFFLGLPPSRYRDLIRIPVGSVS